MPTIEAHHIRSMMADEDRRVYDIETALLGIHHIRDWDDQNRVLITMCGRHAERAIGISGLGRRATCPMCLDSSGLRTRP